MEFQACGADRCIYKKKDRDGWIYVCLYVDNMIVAAKSTTMVNNVKHQISQRFQSKDLGSVKYLLGMEINYDHKKREMSITQQKYLKLTTELFKQSQARVTENPRDPSLKLSGEDSPKTPEEKEVMKRTPYRPLFVLLLYVATCTRPAVAFAVSQLGRFSSDPGQQHWKAAMKVLRYLKSSITFGIHYNRNEAPNQISAYSDADWGNNLDDRRSGSGVLMLLDGGPVVFKSKYQRTVALSSS
uniref:Putative polyprotein n=1 Tax=Albugo laibachii Nc14 TaxID=890382 RepID=F0WFC3_9STRA|nr:putative polyprotein [Albugo laibachii Nc14]|eukprot:CCA19905.1 putative polyprotein [Albugo laibachii Nc14]